MIVIEDKDSTLVVTVGNSHPYVLTEAEVESIETFLFNRAGIAHVVEGGKHWFINPKQRDSGEYYIADSSLAGEWRSLTVGYEDPMDRALSKWVKTIPDGPKPGERWEVTDEVGETILVDVVAIGEELFFAWLGEEDEAPSLRPINHYSGGRKSDE